MYRQNTYWNGFPYLGEDEMRPNDQNLEENLVHRLVEFYKNTGHSIRIPENSVA